MASRPAAGALLVLAALLPLPAAAQGAFGAGAARLEEQVDALSGALARRLEGSPVAAALARRVRLSGNVVGALFEADPASPTGAERRSVWDARVFVDVLLAGEVRVGGTPLARSVGVTAEWELFRLGRRTSDLGDAYLELQGLGGSSWWNVQLGRFQIPVGEGYLRYGKGARDNPFLTNPVGSPWWWDEGLRLYGSDRRGRFGYVASYTNGETPRDFGLDGGDQATLRLFVRPTSWLHLSASVLRSGRAGDDAAPAQGALWLGESWARGFGAGTPLPNVVDGRVVPDGPGRLEGTLYAGADAVLTHPAGARLWLAYGTYEIDSSGPGLYDRRLHTWTAELLLEGRLAAPELRPFYAALRASGLGTYDRDRGYLLDVRTSFRTGYGLRSFDAVSLALGWRMTRWTTLVVELGLQDLELVDGASRLLEDPSGRANYLGAGLGIHF